MTTLQKEIKSCVKDGKGWTCELVCGHIVWTVIFPREKVLYCSECLETLAREGRKGRREGR
jgi:hypothetical protein